MPTNEERREMARSLRELSKDTEEVLDFDLAKTLGLESVSRCGYAPEDVLRLADLIEPEPERTCKKNEHKTGDLHMRCFSCSECDYGWFEDVNDQTFSYCPHCGAKVVDDAD